jgi:4-amino-4-deoxy-L-arabinose transferase-like glycosyltransferase
VVALFLLLIFLLTLLAALAPPGDSDYDSLVYHLTIPKVYLREEGICPLPWLTHSNFPFTLEMLYTVGLALQGTSLAKLFHWGCGWLIALALFGFARRWWGARAGWLGAVIFAAIPLVIWQMTTAYIELGLAFYSFLALAALARYLTDRARVGWLWAAALACGFALGVKMLGGVIFLFALGALLWSLRSASDKRKAFLYTITFTIIAAAVAAPWYLKSYLWTGNPVYPFFYELFDGKWWSVQRAREYTEAQAVFGLGHGWRQFLLLPWNLTMRPQWFFDQPEMLRSFNIYVAVLGPLLLALLPTLLLTGRVGGAGRLALWFALIFTGIWFVLTQNLRYLLPVLPGLAACAGLAATRLLERRGLLASAAVITLGLSFVVGLFPAAMMAAPAARVALGMESQDVYLARTSETYRIFQAVEDATLPSARIMILGAEPRTFYLNRDAFLGDHAELFTAADLASADALLAALRRMGVAHLLLHASTMQNIAARQGTMESRLAELADERRINQVGTYGPMTLWHIASENNNPS